jgi:ParB family transcriptional regulator, chromosome partitioning protein
VERKPVLGKGLASLFPGMHSPEPSIGAGATSAGAATTVQQQEFNNRDRHPGISLAGVDEILTNPYQPRREFEDRALTELSESIKANGVIQPLVVRKNAAGKYQLIAGERRLRAAKLAGLKQVPVVIRRSTDREALELALVENIQRQDLNCIDEALAYFQLVQDFGLTQEDLAQRVGKDRASVANHLRLLRLPEEIIEDLKGQILTLGHGKVLLSLEDNELRMRARNVIIEKALSVRDSEALIEEMKKALNNTGEAPSGSSDVASSSAMTPVKARLSSIGQDLTRQYSARVEIKGNEKRGKIVFHYSSRQELERMLEAMQNRSMS